MSFYCWSEGVSKIAEVGFTSLRGHYGTRRVCGGPGKNVEPKKLLLRAVCTVVLHCYGNCMQCGVVFRSVMEHAVNVFTMTLCLHCLYCIVADLQTVDARSITFRDVIARNPLTNNVIWSKKVGAGSSVVIPVRAVCTA